MRYGFIGLGHLGKTPCSQSRTRRFRCRRLRLQRSAADSVLAAGGIGLNHSRTGEEQRLPDQCLPSPLRLRRFWIWRCRALRQGSTWIEMSTNDFAEVEALAAGRKRWDRHPCLPGDRRRAPRRGRRYHGASWRRRKQLFAMHEPALKAMGGRVIHLGGIEQAAVTKVVTNMLAFIHLIAAGEALMLCAKGGVDLRAAYEAIAASSGNSFVHETESQVILNGSYDIGFTMDLACKDAGFAVEFGRRFGVPLRLAG